MTRYSYTDETGGTVAVEAEDGQTVFLPAGSQRLDEIMTVETEGVPPAIRPFKRHAAAKADAPISPRQLRRLLKTALKLTDAELAAMMEEPAKG